MTFEYMTGLFHTQRDVLLCELRPHYCARSLIYSLLRRIEI